MQNKNLLKAFLLCVIIVTATFTIWEIHLRNKGIKASYDDNESLFATKRALVYEPKDAATVFIGSSRIKYDLDIPTWENLTGSKPIQLAMVGSNPRPVLHNLAEDENFKGRLIVDVTEGLFFSESPYNLITPNKNLEYYKKITPAQRFSNKVNDVLEAKLVFLDKDFFSLNGLLRHAPVPDRPGVYDGPDFPIEFHFTTIDRQNIMNDRFIDDTVLQNKVKNIWVAMGKRNSGRPPMGSKLDSIMLEIKMDCDRIRQRGGEILFVRTPSSGAFLQRENMGFPRQLYWERILKETNCPGIHFSDYPEISHFKCPEFSHLSHPDAKKFTKSLVEILQQKGWQFPSTKKA